MQPMRIVENFTQRIEHNFDSDGIPVAVPEFEREPRWFTSRPIVKFQVSDDKTYTTMTALKPGQTRVTVTFKAKGRGWSKRVFRFKVEKAVPVSMELRS